MMRTMLIFAMAVASMSPAWGEGGFTVAIEEKAPPEALEQDIRDRLPQTCYQLSLDGTLFFELWLLPEWEASALKDTTKETLEKIVEISLLGAIVVHEEDHNDFRDDPIDPGLFVLRMAWQPQDGNHMGTSPFDSFAILMPHDKDFELKDFADHEFMVELASEDTVAEHPPILALQPMAAAEGEFPRIEHDEEDEWYSLCLKISAKAGDDAAELPIHLVFEGIGEL